jgi:D-alanine-D-alanine ligase
MSGYTDEESLAIYDDARAVANALEALGHEVMTTRFNLNLGAFSHDLMAYNPGLVFPLVEGIPPWTERWVCMVQAVLEEMHLPYVGNDAMTMFMTQSKATMKHVLRCNHIMTPEVLQLGSMPGMFIVKAQSMQGSYKLDSNSLVDVVDPAPVLERVRQLSQADGKRFFAERFIEGREFTACILGGDVFVAEVVYRKPGFETFEAKWQTGAEGDLNTYLKTWFWNDDVPGKVGMVARKVWDAFYMSGWARVDMRVSAFGNINVIDVNSNPSLGEADNFIRTVAKFGVTQMEVVHRLMGIAMKRHEKLDGVYS